MTMIFIEVVETVGRNDPYKGSLMMEVREGSLGFKELEERHFCNRVRINGKTVKTQGLEIQGLKENIEIEHISNTVINIEY